MAIYIATYSIDVVALLYLLSMLSYGTSLNSDRKIAFKISTILTIVNILSEAGTIFTGREYLNLRSVNILFDVLGFSLSPMIPLTITLIFDSRIRITHKFLLIPTLINIVATVLSPFFKLIFYIDANNNYMRGKFFFVFIVTYMINYLILVLSTLNVGKKSNYPIKPQMIALTLFTISGTSIQLIDPSIYSSWHCITLTLFLYFLMMSEFDSSFDTLSGLYNRAVLDRVMKGLTKVKTLTAIVIDIDNFKLVNDTYGHNCGDIVIKQVATIIKESFGKHYKCYRLGGDEFVIISEEVDPDKIECQLIRMTKALSEMREKWHILPTVSYGYSSNIGRETVDFNTVLREADERMYQYKRTRFERI